MHTVPERHVDDRSLEDDLVLPGDARDRIYARDPELETNSSRCLNRIPPDRNRMNERIRSKEGFPRSLTAQDTNVIVSVRRIDPDAHQIAGVRPRVRWSGGEGPRNNRKEQWPSRPKPPPQCHRTTTTLPSGRWLPTSMR